MRLTHTSDTGSTNQPFTLNTNVIRQLFKFKIIVLKKGYNHALVQHYKIIFHASNSFLIVVLIVHLIKIVNNYYKFDCKIENLSRASGGAIHVLSSEKILKD